jgi:hypothetical protein
VNVNRQGDNDFIGLLQASSGARVLTYVCVRCGSALRGATSISLTKIIVEKSIGLLRVSSGARVFM